MSLSAYELLQHIRDEADFLTSKSENLTFEEFIDDETLIRAFARSLEIIGEATKKVPKDFKDKFPQIEWRSMAGMRDKLIHDYFGVDYELVWDVVDTKIPILLNELEEVFKHFKE